MQLNYNQFGNLLPNKKELTWEEFLTEFVDNYPDSVTRKKIALNFKNYLQAFKKEIISKFFIWVDGSFVSKKLNPNDLEAVFYIDYKICQSKKTNLDKIWFSSHQKYAYSLDLYYSIDYPKDHKRHFLSHLNYLYWEDIYGSTRVDNQGRSHKKGFIIIKFN